MLHDTRGDFSMNVQRPIFQQTRWKKTGGYAVFHNMKHMMYKDHKEPKNSMYGTQNHLDGFSSFSLQKYGRLEKIRFNQTHPKIMYRRMPKNPITSPITSPIYQSMSHTLPNTPNHIQQYPYPQIYPIISCNIPILSPLYLKTSWFYLQNILFRRLVTWINLHVTPQFFHQNLLFFTPGKLSQPHHDFSARHRAASARPLRDRWSPSVVPSPEDVPISDPGRSRAKPWTVLMWRFWEPLYKGSLGKFASTLESTWWYTLVN